MSFWNKFTAMFLVVFLVLSFSPVIVHAQSITDIMEDYGKGEYTEPDADVMNKASSTISSTVGVVLSVIIMVFFAATTTVTALDLAYLAIPASRSLLYPGGSVSAYSDTGRMHNSGYAGNSANMWANTAQQRAMNGDMAGANRANNFAQGWQNIQNRRDALDANYNAGQQARGQEAADLATRVFDENRCFVSSDLKQLLNTPKSACFGHCYGQQNVQGGYNSIYGQQAGKTQVYVLEYLKARAVSLTITVAVLVVLVGSNMFTNTGLNIGQFIMDQLGSLLGF